MRYTVTRASGSNPAGGGNGVPPRIVALISTVAEEVSAINRVTATDRVIDTATGSDTVFSADEGVVSNAVAGTGECAFSDVASFPGKVTAGNEITVSDCCRGYRYPKTLPPRITDEDTVITDRFVVVADEATINGVSLPLPTLLWSPTRIPLPKQLHLPTRLLPTRGVVLFGGIGFLPLTG